MKYSSISKKTQPGTHQHRKDNTIPMISEYMFLCSPWLISFEHEEALKFAPKKAKKNLKRCIAQQKRWSSKPILQDPWVLTYQPWVIGSHRRCFLGDSWFPDVKSGGRKHLLTREIGLESAGASDQHHVPEYGGRHLASRFQVFSHRW